LRSAARCTVARQLGAEGFEMGMNERHRAPNFVRRDGLPSTVRSSWAALGSSVLLLACNSSLPEDLSGKPCATDGRCVEGYFCDRPTNLCVSTAPPDGRADIPPDGSANIPRSDDGGNESEVAPEPPTCPGKMLCAGQCADVSQDAKNCGSCGKVCVAPGQRCESGSCKPDCPRGFSDCKGSCVALSVDLANCGACGHACAAGQFCKDAKCTSSCHLLTLGAFTECGESCVDLDSDPGHCGACAHKCRRREQCIAGTCQGDSDPD
jgi:hypothetical protein